MNRYTFFWLRVAQGIGVTALVILFILGTIGFFSQAQAQHLRIGVMPTSYHFDRERSDGTPWNETHKGRVIELRITDDGDWLGVMQYQNSVDEESWTIYGLNDRFFTNAAGMDFGLAYGIVSGYSLDIMPYAMPTVSLPLHKHFKVRASYFLVGIAFQAFVEF